LPVWQALREELKDQNFELVTVGLDSLGAEGCRAFIEAANPTHPSLIDRHHQLANLFGVINIPSSIWIDEEGMIVRPAEPAPAPPAAAGEEESDKPRIELPPELPPRMAAMMTEAVKIPNDKAQYHGALRDWVSLGKKSEFAMAADKVVNRSRPRTESMALGHAHFELATQLEIDGRHALAIKHFKKAHELVPDSWTFRRQAWSLEQVGEGPLSRFWQGPNPEHPEDWPYAGGWLEDIKEAGAENYNERFEA
jgi:hypothetical protein